MTEFDARGFAALARELLGAPADEAVTFDLVVKRAVDVVPGCDHAGITLRTRRGRVTTAAHTDQVVLDADELQYELSEGPCLDAAFEDHTYVSNDLTRDERWPTWGPRVAALGVGSVVAVQLTGGARTLGALNLYGAGVKAYDAHAIDVATTFGVLATGVLESAQLISGLETALQSRHVIGMAQGVLVSQFGLSPDRAFEVLRRFSNDANVPLRDVAAQVVEQGQLPRDGIHSPEDATLTTPAAPTPVPTSPTIPHAPVPAPAAVVDRPDEAAAGLSARAAGNGSVSCDGAPPTDPAEPAEPAAP